MLATLRPLCPRCMPRQRTRGRRCARAPRNARRAGAMPPRYLRRQQWISGAAAEDAAAVAVAPATASGWAATRLAQPLRMASAWADAICPAVNRAGAGLRACTRREPARSELCKAIAKLQDADCSDLLVPAIRWVGTQLR